MMRIILHIVLIFLIGNLCAQELSTASKDEQTLIGKPVSLMYKLEAEAPMDVIKMSPLEGIVKGKALVKDTAAQQQQIELEILGKVMDTTYEKDGRYYWEQHYELTAWDSALILLPPQEVIVDDSVMAFPAALFSFTFPSVDSQHSFYDINELFSDTELISENWFLVLVKSLWFWIGLIIAGVLFIAFLLKKKSKKKALIPELPPEEVALDAIRKLEESELYNKDLKAFYVQLSLVLRRFLTHYYNMRLMDKTSAELITVLKMKELSTELQQVAREVLNQSDLVKFAKSKPPLKEVLEVSDKTRTIIKEILEKSSSTINE